MTATAVGGLWQPRSSCGPHCLPAPGQPAPASLPTRARRLAALAATLLQAAVLLPVLPLLGDRARYALGRTWARAVLAALGVRLVERGRLPQHRALLTANHISWLDVVAILAVAPARLLAKHDVRRWPMIGMLAAAAGTIFIDRTRPRRLPETVAHAAAALRVGGVVAVFPEGTTSCGVPSGGCAAAGRFRPAMFQAAIDTGAPIVPLTLAYSAGREGTTAAAFLGSDNLWASLRRVLAVRELTVTVTAAPAVHPDASATRRALARIAESSVRTVPAPTPRSVAAAESPESGPSILVVSRPTPAPSDPGPLGLAA